MTTYTTLHSMYEVDEHARKIRRVLSTHEPTPRQGEDGEWKQFLRIDCVEDGLLIIWNRQGHATLTSPVVTISEDQ